MKIDRLVSIIMILLKEDRISAKELSNMFEVSLRTIYRDIESINLAGIPVRALPGVGGGFEILHQYKVEKGIFSASDLTAMLMGLSEISSILPREEVLNALAKVKGFIPKEKTNEIQFKANQIYIDFCSWTGNRSIMKNLRLIQDSLSLSRILLFDYAGIKSLTRERKVLPCKIVLKNCQWYLYGFCMTRNDYRIFKLSRMINLEMTQESFIPREYPSPVIEAEEYLNEIQQSITLRIHKSISDRVLDFCGFEHFKADGNDYFIVDFPFIENDYHYDVLLGLGSKCECLSPLHVREELLNRINNLRLVYEQKS